MGMIFTLKMLCETAYFMYYSAFFTAYFTDSAPPMAALIALALCCGVSHAIRVKRPAWRLAPFAGLLSWIFLVGTWADLLALAPCAVYAVILCLKWQYFINVDEFRAQFVLWTKIMPILLVFGLILSRSALELRALPFGVVYLFASVFLLRLLRHDEAVLNQTRFRILNAFSLAGVALAGLVCSSQMFLTGVRTALAVIYKYTLAPVLMLFAYIFVFILWCLEPLGELIQEAINRLAEMRGQEKLIETTVPEETFEELFKAVADNTNITETVFRALLVLALVAVAIVFFRRLLKNRTAPRIQGGVFEQRVSIAAVDQPRRRAERGPREQVRAVYRKFLTLCLDSGVGIRHDDTSRDVLSRAEREAWFGKEADALREIYISARYSEGEVTRGDVKAAKEQYAALRSRSKKTGP